jgi:NTE family protein
MNDANTVSLVLGSGGARGLAHIGVIRCLEEQGFEIASIAGASMGALVGGIYATGRLETYARWVTALEKMDVLRLLDPSFSRNSLFKGERIISVLKDLIGDHNIEDLPVSFTAVATDLDRGKEVWLNHGSLFDAVRASIAIPTVFAPYRHEGRRLVDGGLVNPIPIAPTLRDATDLTIAVNLSAKEGPAPEHKPDSAPDTGDADDYRTRIRQFVEELQTRWGQQETDELGLFDVISKTMDTMQNTIARLKLAAYSPDIIIDIPRNSCTFYEFHRGRELIEIGYRNAAQALRDLHR